MRACLDCLCDTIHAISRLRHITDAWRSIAGHTSLSAQHLFKWHSANWKWIARAVDSLELHDLENLRPQVLHHHHSETNTRHEQLNLNLPSRYLISDSRTQEILHDQILCSLSFLDYKTRPSNLIFFTFRLLARMHC